MCGAVGGKQSAKVVESSLHLTMTVLLLNMFTNLNQQLANLLFIQNGTFYSIKVTPGFKVSQVLNPAPKSISHREVSWIFIYLSKFDSFNSNQHPSKTDFSLSAILSLLLSDKYINRRRFYSRSLICLLESVHPISPLLLYLQLHRLESSLMFKVITFFSASHG